MPVDNNNSFNASSATPADASAAPTKRSAAVGWVVFLAIAVVLMVVNAAAWLIAVTYAFSFEGEAGPGPLLSVFGPIALYVAWPVVIVQNAFPFYGFARADTLFGVVTVSLAESALLTFALPLAWASIKRRGRRAVGTHITPDGGQTR